ncbi:Yippee/Mis18, partial [Helicostylum pulchrum]
NYLDQCTTFFSCTTCHAHLLNQQDIVSRAFQGKDGPAFLAAKVENMSIGAPEDRMLMTGVHTVADISCHICNSRIGWIYLRAPDPTQQYKVGKCIIEKQKVIKE